MKNFKVNKNINFDRTFSIIFCHFHRAPLSSASLQSRVRIYSTENTNQIPLALSVDWLNDKLYILFESISKVRILLPLASKILASAIFNRFILNLLNFVFVVFHYIFRIKRAGKFHVVILMALNCK